MDLLSEHFLRILRASLKGEKTAQCEELTAEDWQDLMTVAQSHSVLPMFYEAVYSVGGLWKLSPALAASAKQQVMHQVLVQTMRTSEFLRLNQRLRRAGIRPLVVKGIICRNLYPQPDHRPSGDEDVLIPPDRFPACHEALLAFGMETTAPETGLVSSYEVPYRKKGSPLYIELHKHLFPPESAEYGEMNRFFEGVFERAVEVEIQGERVCTMGHTDHLFYLICHAFKHFLHSGFGIRQVCDIVLYANAWGSQVDWLRVLENCREIRADLFAAALFRIGERHLVFDPEKACYPARWRQIQVDETAMLEDLLSGGLYGYATMSRRHSSNITLDAVAAQKRGKRTGGGLVKSLFPGAKKLEGRYGYLKKHPWLLPAAWCDRILKYGKETRETRDNSAAEAVRIGRQRVALMRQYGIID